MANGLMQTKNHIKTKNSNPLEAAFKRQSVLHSRNLGTNQKDEYTFSTLIKI